MFDTRLRQKIDPLLEAIASRLAQHITANQLTLIGLTFAFFAFFALLANSFLLATILIIINRVLDGLDGALARATSSTPYGAFLDSACDFIFYGLIPLGFALNSPTNELATTILLFSFYLNGGFFLAFAALTHEKTAQKGFYYLSGLAEGAETIGFFLAFCLWPSHYTILAYIFAAACLISAAARLVLAKRLLKIGD